MRLSAEPRNATSEPSAGWITHIQRFSLHDGPGIRSVVFLKGCQMRCLWCANPEGLHAGSDLFFHAERCLHCGTCAQHCPAEIHRWVDKVHTLDRSRQCQGCRVCEERCPAAALNVTGEKLTPEAVFNNVMADETWFRQSGGGVTLSGGEVLVQPGFASQLLQLIRAEDIHTAMETAGYAPWRAVQQVASVCDLILYDLKSADDEQHKRYTGVSNRIIVRNLKRLLQGERQIIIRIPVIPHFNDAPDQAEELLQLISSLTRHRPAFNFIELLPYHCFGTGKYALLNKAYAWNDSTPQVENFLQRAHKYNLPIKVSGALVG
ncbi:MAG TPA: glycyl-radical enzyme activating protein [Leclercia adecarboxylata]|nr:glycyl-radical enzyme activating protein [Leclercia adecarboxylata]